MCNWDSLGMDEIPTDHDNGMTIYERTDTQGKAKTKNKSYPKRTNTKMLIILPIYKYKAHLPLQPSQPCHKLPNDKPIDARKKKTTFSYPNPLPLHLHLHQTIQSKIPLHLPTTPLMSPVLPPPPHHHHPPSTVDLSPTYYQSYYQYP
jgi:hypothetical protein